MKITAIRPAGRDRAEVEVEGVVRGVFLLEIIIGAELRLGQDVDEGRLQALESRSVQLKVKQAALDLLSYRERSVTELVQRLVKKGFEKEVAEKAVSALAESGLVSDERFAEALVRERTNLKPQGRYRLLRELAVKGVDEETAKSAVEEVLEEKGVSEAELAREAAMKWRPKRGEDPRKGRARLYAFLARRGFAPDAIRSAMEELGESPQGEEDEWLEE